MTRIRLDVPSYVHTILPVLDPWHADALSGTPSAAVGATGERRLMWYGADHRGNLVAALGPASPGQYVERDADGVLWMVTP